jgi:solute carrier family 25 carnitine/acylcarnitine transporter 20/29
MVKHADMIRDEARGDNDTRACILASSYVSPSEPAAATTRLFPTSMPHFAAVGKDVSSYSTTSSSSDASTMPSQSRMDDYHPVKYHQVDDDHIPIPPIFFPNPGRHSPHHVHVPPIATATPSEVKVSTSTTATQVTAIQEEEIAEVSTLNDLVAGGMAGTVSVFVGHPFDTIKVRYQSGAGISSLKPNITSMLSLFRGMGPPLVSAGAVNALVFSAYGWSSRVWDTAFESSDITGTKQFVCGAFSGLLQTFILCPTEHVKCRLQVQETSPHPRPSHFYKGPTDAARQILKSHGLFRGLYRGWSVTAWREVPAFGLYFSTYDVIKNFTNRKLGSASPDQPTKNPWIASALAGGASGCFTWALIYPFDVIKTRIQTRSLHCKKGIYQTGLDIITESGWRAMFRGLGVTLIRAFPVNGVIFPVYEFTLLKLTGADRMVD